MASEYYSCKHIESEVLFSNEYIAFCCVPNNGIPLIEYYNEASLDIDNLLNLRNKSRSNPLPVCATCPSYKLGHWDSSRKIKKINIAYMIPCNFRCEYCTNAKTGRVNYPKKQTNIIPYLEQLYNNDMISEHCIFLLATGEPAFCEHLDKIVEIVEKVNGYITILSNASIYNASIEYVLSKNIGSLCCSMDAGTRETFKHIKGVDMFDKVVENMSRYARHDGVEAKYIVYESNYDEKEVMAFVKRVSEIGIRHIMFDFNYHERNNSIPDKYIDSMALGKYLAESVGIRVRQFSTEVFAKQKDDIIKRVEEMIRKNHSSYDDILADILSKNNIEKTILNSQKTAEIMQIGKSIDQQADAGRQKTIIISPVFEEKIDCGNDFDALMNKCGNNIGNLFFVNMMKKQLTYESELYFNSDYGHIDKTAAGVIPSSNFIFSRFEKYVELLTKTIQRVPFPITLAGVGAQSLKADDTPKDVVATLSESFIRNFRTIADQCVSLGARGAFTAECLELMGIKNYRIIGCPAVYNYLDGVFKPLNPISTKKTLINITTGNFYETKLLKLAMQSDSKWIMQMRTEFPHILMTDELIPDHLMKRNFPGVDIQPEELQQFIKRNAKIFFSINEWDNYLQNERFSFSFGSRFHGNLMSLKNGVPALWLTHDSRTTELMELFRLPNIDYRTFEKVSGLEELLEYCDYSEFYRRYNEMLANYIQYLDENGLDHNFSKRKEASQNEAPEAPILLDNLKQADYLSFEYETVKGCFERVGRYVADSDETFAPTLIIEKREEIHILGWIINSVDECAFHSMCLCIDNTLYEAEKVMRPDIVRIHGNEKYLMSGFRLSIPASALKAGEHRLMSVGITADGRRCRIADTIQLRIIYNQDIETRIQRIERLVKSVQEGQSMEIGELASTQEKHRQEITCLQKELGREKEHSEQLSMKYDSVATAVEAQCQVIEQVKVSAQQEDTVRRQLSDDVVLLQEKIRELGCEHQTLYQSLAERNQVIDEISNSIAKTQGEILQLEYERIELHNSILEYARTNETILNAYKNTLDSGRFRIGSAIIKTIKNPFKLLFWPYWMIRFFVRRTKKKK